MKLKQSRSVMIDSEGDVYSLTLVGNIRGRAGRVKLIAKNVTGELTLEADLLISGSPPTFVEQLYISQVLEGQKFLLFKLTSVIILADSLHVQQLTSEINVHYLSTLLQFLHSIEASDLTDI